uniref:RGS domain-containing protein n=1 Tax=Callorhinchus milii TaxID=7868 RepID=A0A4W3JRG3_CALMI
HIRKVRHLILDWRECAFCSRHRNFHVYICGILSLVWMVLSMVMGMCHTWLSKKKSVYPVQPIDCKAHCFSSAGQAAFRTFLKKEFSDENIDFWLACEDYKKTKSATKLASKAKKIYSEFIKSNAPKEINIDFVTREAITRNIGTPTHSSFDMAQEVIYSLMAKDCYPRFLRSDTYLELLKNKIMFRTQYLIFF